MLDGRTDGDVMVKVGQGATLTVREKLLWAVWAPPGQPSVALMVKLKVLAVVGVPERWPDVFKFKPVGSDPDTTLNVVGICPPVAWI